MVKKFIEFPCLKIAQDKALLVCFVIQAKELWNIVEINQRDPDKDKGYQRVLSTSRVNSIKRFIEKGNSIPLSILIGFDERSKLIDKDSKIKVPNINNAGWVIDGQHRLAGAKEAKVDFEVCVIAIVNATEQEQINQFITINEEAIGVPRSLYYDLLRKLPPNKSESDLAKERAVDIANQLKKDELSPFFSKIVITSPNKGEISLNNFVRKVYPLLGKNGFFKDYTLTEQTKILDNYFKAFKNHFPKYFEYATPLFYQTVGFGALINALPTIFGITLKTKSGFAVSDIIQVINKIDYFDFGSWLKIGTGTAAEKQASDDLQDELRKQVEDDTNGSSESLRL